MACGKILSKITILSIWGFALPLLELFGSVGGILVTKPPESVTIVQGDPAVFHCEISGIQWWQGVVWQGTYKYNFISTPWYINANRNAAILHGDVSSVADRHGDHYVLHEQLDNEKTRFYYSVYNTTLYDQGDYGCGYYDTRISRGDRDLFEYEITDLGNFAKLKVLTTSTCYFQPLPLPFEKPDADTHITLTCVMKIEGDNPILTWYRNEEVVSSSSGRSNSFTYDITIADNGVNFSCVASAPYSPRNPSARSCSLTPLKKAFIEPKRQAISMGNNASFTCSADGLQISKISWVTNGTSNPSIKVTESTSTFSKLQVTDIQLEDSETKIICQVTLVTGDILNAAASLDVEKPSQKPVGQLSPYYAIPIVFGCLVLFLLYRVLKWRCQNSRVRQTNTGVDNRAMDPKVHLSVSKQVTISVLHVNVNGGASGNTQTPSGTPPSRHDLKTGRVEVPAKAFSQ